MLLVILACSMLGTMFATESNASEGTILKIEPAFVEFGNSAGDPIPIPGTQFNVTVKIYNVVDLYGFDLTFRWNTTFLQHRKHDIHVSRTTFSDGVLWNPVIQLTNEINDTAGTYRIAYASMLPAPGFNGNGTIFTITLEIKKQPYSYEVGGAEIDHVDTILDFSSTDLAKRDPVGPIPHNIETALVRIWERSFIMPSNPTLKVMPNYIERLPTNSTFNIDIWIMGLNQSYDIASLNITLNFNSTLLKAISILDGTFPNSYAETITELVKQVDNTYGTATYAIELDSRKPEPPIEGILFTVTFCVTYESLIFPSSFSELMLAPTTISDRTQGPISHIRENGTYVANRPLPVAKFTPSSGYFLKGQAITFNASESYQPLGGKILLYAWDFGDGTRETETKPAISHTYLTNGTMTVVLNVTDYGGFWNTKSTILYIVETPPKPYLALDPTYVRLGPLFPRVVGEQFNISICIRGLDTGWSLQKVRFSISYNTTLIDIEGDSANVTIPLLWKGPNEVTVVRQAGALGKATITLGGPSVTPGESSAAATIKFTVAYQGIYPVVDSSPLVFSDISLTGPFGEIPVQSSINGEVSIEGSSLPSIEVEPPLIEYHENAVGKEFTVAVKIVNVTNLYAFDLEVRWNTTVLEYVGHSVRVPKDTYSDGVLWNPIFQLVDTPDQISGTYRIAYSSILPAASFNATGVVFTITFRIKYHPVQPAPTANIRLELYSTDLSNNAAQPISHNTEYGLVTLYQIPPDTMPASLQGIIPYVAGAVAITIVAIVSLYLIKIRKPKLKNQVR